MKNLITVKIVAILFKADKKVEITEIEAEKSYKNMDGVLVNIEGINEKAVDISNVEKDKEAENKNFVLAEKVFYEDSNWSQRLHLILVNVPTAKAAKVNI